MRISDWSSDICYALDSMAGDASNDTRIISALFELDARGFQAEEFRESAAHAIEKIASRKADIDEAIVEILVSWLKVATLSIDEGEEEEDVELTLGANEEGLSERSILWGYNGSSVIPGGNFNVRSALFSVLLNNEEASREIGRASCRERVVQ